MTKEKQDENVGKSFIIVIAVMFLVMLLMTGVDLYVKATHVRIEATVTDVGSIKTFRNKAGKQNKSVRKQECTLSYSYDGNEYRFEKEYVKIYSLFGFKEGEVIVLYIDPENPEEYLTFENNKSSFVLWLLLIGLAIFGTNILIKKGYLTSVKK